MRLPIVIAGRRIDRTSGDDQRITTRTNQHIDLPYLDTVIADHLESLPGDTLADVSIHEIISFLHNVGHNWKSPEYSRRRLYIRHLCKFLGYSEAMAEAEANWIAFNLSSHFRLYDSLSAELGGWQMLEDWIPNEEAYIRALPHGKVFHLVPGNVPLSSVVSIIRAIITKNVSIVKASSDDLITPITLALSFMDVDRDHPVTRSLSVVHWPGGKDEAHHRQLVASANAVCAWGATDSIEWAKRNAAPDSALLTFGPKRSLAVIGGDADLEKAARALAHDVSVYDQRACFSIQHVYYEGDTDDLMEHLAAAFENIELLLPKGEHSFDERAGVSLSRLQSDFSCSKTISSAKGAWTIIAAPAGESDIHPLGRTVYLHAINTLTEVEPYIDRHTQTVAVYPADLAIAVRDRYTRQGACRIVELGMNNIFRVGGAHDGIFPLQRLVRMASMELPSKANIKGIAIPVDQTRFLEEDRFLEFIP